MPPSLFPFCVYGRSLAILLNFHPLTSWNEHITGILAPLFGCHQQLLLDDLRGRRALGMKNELEVSDDLINDFMIIGSGNPPGLFE